MGGDTLSLDAPARISQVGAVQMEVRRGDVMPISEAMLSQDVFAVPVDSLVDIWMLRFSNSWVNLDDIEADEFFKMAYVRLKSLGKLETHYLTDRAKYVCRKPE